MNNFFQFRTSVIFILVVVSFFTGCKKEETTAPNSSPTQPASPSPSNNGTGISTTPTLSWSCNDPENDPITYDIYFGTDSAPAARVGTERVRNLRRNGLSANTTYYWKIVAKDSHGNISTGPVWKFTTAPAANRPPAYPSLPYPENNAAWIVTSPSLSWSCADPENDPLTYDIYFGTENPPSEVISSSQTVLTMSRTGLSVNTSYYWKIVAKDNHGNSTSGSVWKFTTGSSASGAPCPGTPTVVYSGKTYHTVQIGSQCWLRENLDVGTMIDSLQNADHNGVIEKYCYHNDPANCAVYGGLYQWSEAMEYNASPGAQGICPVGWHIPAKADFDTLAITVGWNSNTLKSVGEGSGDGAGANTTGFSAVAAGERDYYGYFHYRGDYMIFWSSSLSSETLPYYMDLFYDTGSMCLCHGSHYLTDGLSIRCVKD